MWASSQVNCESRLATAGPVAGGGGVVGLVLHGKLQFQLNQGLTLIPAPHTQEAEHRGSPKTHRGLPPPSNVICHHQVYSQVSPWGQSRNNNIRTPRRSC